MKRIFNFFFGITNTPYDIYENHAKYGLQKHYLPIALDSFGNSLLLDRHSFKIWFMDHETEDLFFVAETFSAFLEIIEKFEITENDFDKAVSRQDISYFEDITGRGIAVSDIINEFGQPLIIVAALRNKLKIVEYCVLKGADPDLALFSASSNGHIDIVRFLIHKGADINIRDKEQNNDTALLQAAQSGYLEIAKLLIENGADIHLEDHHGNNALEKSRWSGNQGLVKYLESIY